jgi:hypothetical protein
MPIGKKDYNDLMTAYAKVLQYGVYRLLFNQKGLDATRAGYEVKGLEQL